MPKTSQKGGAKKQRRAEEGSKLEGREKQEGQGAGHKEVHKKVELSGEGVRGKERKKE
jgi:hypothetical protein